MGIPQVANDENTCLSYGSCVSSAEVVAWEEGSRGVHEGLSVRDDREESNDLEKLRELKSRRENLGKTPICRLAIPFQPLLFAPCFHKRRLRSNIMTVCQMRQFDTTLIQTNFITLMANNADFVTRNIAKW